MRSLENLPENGNERSGGEPEQRALVVEGNTQVHYKKYDPKTHISHLQKSSPSASRGSGFGSRVSEHGLGSGRSLVSLRPPNFEHGLASSCVSLGVPVPLGASQVILNEEDIKSQDDIDKAKTAPSDRCYIVYLIFVLHGIGTLLPWNMFLTADSYFTDFKLAAKGNDTETEYAKNFLSYLGITAQISSLIMTMINAFSHVSGSRTNLRVVVAICSMIFVFVITIILAMLNSNDWQGGFFAVTMVTVVIINMCSGVYQSSMFGVCGMFPMKYTNALILGSNISGVFTAVIMVLSILGLPDIQLAAIWYFMASVMVLCLALISFVALFSSKYYCHFTKPSPVADITAANDQSGKDALLQNNDEAPLKIIPPYKEIFKKIWVQLLGVWLVFTVTLACFPAVQADIELVNPNLMPANLYTPITTFLSFNFFATLGNLATEKLRKPGPKYVIIPILLRLLFIPFFIFCNFRPETRTIPVHINNDWAYIFGNIAMAFTSGYFSSLCMMYAPRLVDQKWAKTAGMLSSMFLVLGVFTGVNLSLAVVKFAEI